MEVIIYPVYWLNKKFEGENGGDTVTFSVDLYTSNDSLFERGAIDKLSARFITKRRLAGSFEESAGLIFSF